MAHFSSTQPQGAVGGPHTPDFSQTAGASVHGTLRGPETAADTLVSTQRVGTVRVTVQEHEYMGKLEQDLTYLAEKESRSMSKIDRLRMHRTEVRRYNMKEKLLEAFEAELDKRDRELANAGHGSGFPIGAVAVAHRVVNIEQWKGVLRKICHDAVETKAIFEWENHVKADLAAEPLELAASKKWKKDPRHDPGKLKAIYLQKAETRKADLWKERAKQVASLHGKYGGDFYRFANSFFDLLGADAGGGADDPFGGIVNRFGFVNPAPEPMEEQRIEFGKGPLDKGSRGVRTGKQWLLAPHQVPLRIKYTMGTQYCLTCVQPPSAFDSRRIMARSGTKPKIGLQLEHVHNFCARRNGKHFGQNLHFCRPVEEMDKVTQDGVAQPYGGKITPMAAFYSAGVGVVMDLRPTEEGGLQQRFFKNHTNDITCLTVHPNGVFIATGQEDPPDTEGACGPFVCIWHATTSPDGPRDGTWQIAEVGIVPVDDDDEEEGDRAFVSAEGLLASETRTSRERRVGGTPEYKCFYKRAIGAVEFSHDGEYLVASGEDDNHTIGVWKWETGQLVGTKGGIKGTAPEIFDITWGRAHTTRKDCNCHFVTHGPSHLNFWKFDDSQRDPKKALSFQAAKIPAPHPQPQLTTCVTWTNAGNVVTGGSNGCIYVWNPNNAKLLHSFEAHPLPKGVRECVARPQKEGGHTGVLSLAYKPPTTDGPAYLLSGGRDGKVQVWPTKNVPADPLQHGELQFASKVAGDKGGANGKGGKSRKPNRRCVAIREPTAIAETGIDDGGRAAKGGPAAKKQFKLGRESSNSTRVRSVFETRLIEDSTTYAPREGVCAIAVDHCGRAIIGTDFSQLKVLDDIAKEAQPRLVLNGHFRRTCALAAWSPKDETSKAGFFITGGDDGLVCKWSVGNMAHRSSSDQTKKIAPAMVCSKVLRQRKEHGVMDYEVKRRLKCRGVGISASGKLAAVGCADGSIVMLRIPEEDASKDAPQGATFEILAVKNLPDANSAIDVVRFSPDDKMLAIGSHDNYVEIFDLPNEDEYAGGKYRIKKRHRCKGHSSFITGLDWSSDSCVIQSNCAGREILYWDAATGQQKRSTLDSVESDTDWATWTCQLGFPVMGIWGDGFASNDINAVHRSRNKRFLVTSTDYGDVRLFNAPCVLEDAPFRKAWGHASHVMHVRFVEGNDENGRDDKRSMRVASVGGADAAVFQWKIDFTPDAPDGRGGFNPALLEEWDGSDDEGDSGDDEAERQAELDAEREARERLERERKQREAAELKRKNELEEEKRRLAELELQQRQDASASTSALKPDKQQVLVVKIVQAENLAKADKDLFTRKAKSSDPFCEVLWGGDCYGKTDVVKKNCNPKWGGEKETFRFHLPPQNVSKGVKLSIVVYDKDFWGKDFLGQVTLTHDATQHSLSDDGKCEKVPSLYSFDQSETEVKLTLQKRADGLERKQKFVQGTITLKFAVEEHTNGSDIKGLSSKQEADEIDAVALQNDRAVKAAQHLHVHVHDAADLRAADGLIKATSSDPFARIIWNGEKLANGETRHIEKTLNPTWDEFFEIPTEKLVLKVMDHDTGSKDDFMGMVQIEGEKLLSPEDGGSLKPYISANDPRPQEYDLTVQKGSADTSDVQTEGGGAKLWAQIATVDTLLITIKACHGLVGADSAMFKKKTSDPRVKLYWCQKSSDSKAEPDYELKLDTWEPEKRWDWDDGRNTSSYKERWRQKGTVNPQWDTSCCVDIVVKEADLAGASLKFEVWDHDTVTSDEFLGQTVVPGDKIMSFVGAEDATLKLEKGSGEAPDTPQKKWADALKKCDDLGSISFSVEQSKRLRVQCTKATNLKKTDLVGSSDPYVIVSWNNVIVGKTEKLSNELNPVWTEEHNNVFFVPRQELMVQLWDRDKSLTEGVSNDYLGHTTLMSDHIGRFTEAQCYKRHMLSSRPQDIKDKKPAKGKVGLALFAMSKLRVQIRRCVDLKKSDPTCKVFWSVDAQPGDDIATSSEAHVGDTSVKRLGSTKGLKNPLWHNEFFEVHLPKHLARAKMLIEVWSSKAFLGQVELGSEQLHRISSMSSVERAALEYELKPAPGAKGSKGQKQDSVGGWIGLSFSVDHGTMPHREMLYPLLDTARTETKAQDEDKSQDATEFLPARCDLRRVEPDAQIRKMKDEEQQDKNIFLQVPHILDAIGCPKANLQNESEWRDKLNASLKQWMRLEGPKDEVVGTVRSKPTAWRADDSYKNHFNADDEDETYWRALSLPTGARHGLQLQVCGAQGLAKTDGSTKPICKVFFEGAPGNPDNEKCIMKSKGVPGTQNVVWGGSSLDESKEPTWQGEGATPPTLQLPHMAVRVEVWDHDKAGLLTFGDREAKGYDTAKDFLGQVIVEGEQLRKAVERGETLSKLPLQRDWTRASKESEHDHTHNHKAKPTLTLKFDCETKLRVDVLSATNLPNCDKAFLSKKLGQPDPWVEVHWGPADEDPKDEHIKLQTDPIENTNDPSWDRNNSVDIPWNISDGQPLEQEKNYVLRLEVWDTDSRKRKQKAHLLGEHVLDFESLEKLMAEAEDAQKAGIELPVCEEPLKEPNAVRESVKNGKKGYLDFVHEAQAKDSKIRFQVVKQQITRVHCISADCLAAADDDGTSQPFCKVFLNDALIARTAYVATKKEDFPDKKSKEIMFGKDGVVTLPRQKIRVEVLDDNLLKDTLLGQVTIESDNFGSFLRDENQGILPLQRATGQDEVQGSLKLALCRTDILYVHTATAVELHAKAKHPTCHVVWDGNKVLPLGENKKSFDGRQMKKLINVPWGEPKDALQQGAWKPAQLFSMPVPADDLEHRLEFEVWSAGSFIGTSKACLGGAQFNLRDIHAMKLPRSFGDGEPHEGYDLHRLSCVPGVNKKQDLMQGWLGLRMAIDDAGSGHTESENEVEQAAAAAKKDS